MRNLLFSGQLKPRLFIAYLLISSVIYLPPSLAKFERSTNNSSESIKIRFVLANPDPPDRGTPRTDRGTGSRGDCLYKPNSTPLTALVGGKNLELTTNERPTFWVYVPYTPQEAPSGEFSLQDGEEDIYRTRFQLPSTPGIVSITFPSTQKPLEIGKTYRWYFEINCARSESAVRTTPASVTGLVRLASVPDNLEEELSSAKTPLERIAAYAQHSIWYDALTELAQLRLNKSQNADIEKIWIELLSDRNVGLQNIVRESITGNVITSSPPE